MTVLYSIEKRHNPSFVSLDKELSENVDFVGDYYINGVSFCLSVKNYREMLIL
jgi:hypothetical protein